MEPVTIMSMLVQAIIGVLCKDLQRFLKVLNVWAVAAAVEQAAITCYDTLFPFHLL